MGQLSELFLLMKGHDANTKPDNALSSQSDEQNHSDDDFSTLFSALLSLDNKARLANKSGADIDFSLLEITENAKAQDIETAVQEVMGKALSTQEIAWLNSLIATLPSTEQGMPVLAQAKSPPIANQALAENIKPSVKASAQQKAQNVITSLTEPESEQISKPKAYVESDLAYQQSKAFLSTYSEKIKPQDVEQKRNENTLGRGNPLPPSQHVDNLLKSPQLALQTDNQAKLTKLASALSLLVKSPLAKAKPLQENSQLAPSVVHANTETTNALTKATPFYGKSLSTVQREAAFESINEHINLMFSKNLKQANLWLDPPELGRLKIKLTLSQDIASVQFTATNVFVKEAIEQSMPRLKEMFLQNGVQLAQSSVQQESDSGSSFTDKSTQQQNEHRKAPLHSHLWQEQENEPVPEKSQWKIQNQGIDYYA